MKTIWKEKYIGEIIGGYLHDSYLYIYQTYDLILVNNHQLVCYINGDNVISYEDKSQTQTKKIGSAIAGDILFGTVGALSFGNQTNYLLEITWYNNEKSLVKIEGEQFYNFFVSKLYEKTSVKKKTKEEILEEKVAECNVYLEKDEIESAVSKLMETIPYYKFIFNNCDIYEYDNEINEYKKTSKDYLNFLENCHYSSNYINKASAINRLKMIKSGNIFAKNLYANDKEIKMITDKEYEKYAKYDSDELYEILKNEEKNDAYDYLKNEHESNGYIFFDRDKDMLLKQLIDIKEKIPKEIYSFILRVVNNNDNNDLNPTYLIVSKIVNTFLGKYDLTHYGHDGGLLKIITISPNVKKYLDKLIEIGDNRKLENEFFESLDVDEQDDFFEASNIYMEKYVMEENIDIQVDNSENK